MTVKCEVWSLIKKMEYSLTIFENKISRKMCSSIFDAERDKWRMKCNNQLREKTRVPWITSFIKSQIIKW